MSETTKCPVCGHDEQPRWAVRVGVVIGSLTVAVVVLALLLVAKLIVGAM